MPPLSAPRPLFAPSPLGSIQLCVLPPSFAKMAPMSIVVSALPGFLSHEPRLAATSVTGFCNREPVTVVVGD
jgi:hypothetical protein